MVKFLHLYLPSPKTERKRITDPWDEKGYGIGPDFACYIALPHGILVNPRTGDRFVNELGDRRVRADAIFQVGVPCIALTDSDGVTRSGYSFERCLKKGIVKAFDTIASLAACYGMPARPALGGDHRRVQRKYHGR